MTKEYFYFQEEPVENQVNSPEMSGPTQLITTTTPAVQLTDHDINSLVSQYNNKTKDVIEKHGILVNLRQLKEDYYRNLDNTVDKNMTKKRMIEMSLDRTRRIDFLISKAMYLLIIVGVLLVFPILYKLNVLSKTTSLVIWGLGVVAIVLLALYFVYLENPKRNVHNFNSLDFENPGSKGGNGSAASNGGMFDGVNDISPDMFDRYISNTSDERCPN